MSLETAIWRMTDKGPVALGFEQLELESQLEDLVIKDPSMIGLDLLVVGRQVTTAYSGSVDTLGVDGDGQVHIVELKRHRTPRDVVAQTLDYGSWATDLSLEDVTSLYAEHNGGDDFESAFAKRFSRPLPDIFNSDQVLTIVAATLDPASERIVGYLADRFGVPINAVFFRYFQDGGDRFLTRTWLLPPDDPSAPAGRSRTRVLRPWNGRDYYVVLGRADGVQEDRWEIALKHGLLTAGGGSWYWKPLRNLSPGNRVFAYVAKAGYVGVGEVIGEMRPAREYEVDAGGTTVAFPDAPGVSQAIADRARSLDEEITEMAVPVRWLRTLPIGEAVSAPGLFASQVTVCKLRDENTITTVEAALGLAEVEPG